MKSSLVLAFLFFAITLTSARSADGIHQTLSDRFCIVPVQHGTPTESYGGETWRMVSVTFEIPGLPAPVFTPHNKGQWTIDARRRFAPYKNPYPYNFFDRGNWVFEPWNSRVVATVSQFARKVRATAGTNLFLLKSGSTQFIAMNTDGKYVGLGSIPSRQLTAATDENGAVYKVGEIGLALWMSRSELERVGIPGISKMYDAPSLSAVIAVVLDQTLHLLDDQNKWHRIGALGEKDYGQVFDAPGSGVALFLGNRSVRAIKRTISTSGNISFTTQTLRTGHRASQFFKKSKQFGQLLQFSKGGVPWKKPVWKRLTADGFIDIDGGDVASDRPDLFPNGRIAELTTLGRVAIYGRERLHLYDGERIYPVSGSGDDRLGKLPRVVDLPSIGRVIAVARTGLFDLSADGKLTEIATSFPTGGLPPISIADWPESGVALASTPAGLFVIDRHLKTAPVQGGELISYGWLGHKVATVSSTGEFLLKSKQGLFLVVDRARAGSDVCDRQYAQSQSIPASSLCLAPLPGTTEDDLGFAIGSWLPTRDGKGLLIDTVRGLFHLDDRFKLQNLQPRIGQSTRSLVRLPWSDEILSVGGGQETIIHGDLSVASLNEDRQSSELIGLVSSLKGVIVREFDNRSGSHKTYLVRKPQGSYEEVEISRTFKRLFDTPWWNHATIDTSGGFHALTVNGSIERFEMTEAPKLNFRLATQLSSLNRTFGVSDAMTLNQFKSILAWSQSAQSKHDKGWYLITENKVWKPVLGLPPATVVLAYHDPGVGSILLGTDKGLYRLDKEATAVPLTGIKSPRKGVRAFSESADGQYILAGGDEGLFRVSQDLDHIEPWHEDMELALGSVGSFTEAQPQGFVFVHASLGTFVINRQDQLRRVSTLSPVKGISGIAVLPKSGRIFAIRRRDANGAMIFSVGRKTGTQKCSSLQ